MCFNNGVCLLIRSADLHPEYASQRTNKVFKLGYRRVHVETVSLLVYRENNGIMMANSRSFCKRIYYARKSIDVCDVIIVRILYRYYVIFFSYQEDRVGAVPCSFSLNIDRIFYEYK